MKLYYIVFRYFIRFSLLGIILFSKKFIERNKGFFDDFYPVIHSVVSFFLFLIIVNIATAVVIMFYRLRKNLPYKYYDNVINGLNNIYYLVVSFGIVVMFLGFWDVDIKSLLTSLSIVAAALAIISKEYVNSIISGLIISFSHEISIDDYVKISGQKGKILDISLAKITLLNDDDDIIYIPNDKVYLSEIINYTKREIRKVSIDFELNLDNFTSMEQLEKTLVDSLKDYDSYIEKDSYNVKVVDVKHDYLFLKFQYTLKEINRDIERSIRKLTIRQIVNNIREDISHHENHPGR
ncbi:MAG TPA: mechanosensitive ion channel [Saprospiraceae bacterium]|nr:mechanosensitive ion channel [Saprospiraceae bacterium]HRP42773.1 mechanosensitive ion channel [Saprospiraceae bacterium]